MTDESGILTQQISQSLLVVEQTVGTRGWDQPPQVAVIHNHADQLTIGTLPMPDDVWEAAGGHPGPFLEMITDPELARRLAALVSQEGLVALVVCCESWIVKWDTTRPMAEYEAEREKYKDLSEHPDAVEVRNIFAVDRLGRPYSCTRERASGEVKNIHGYETGQGRMLEAMKGALNALLNAPRGKKSKKK